MLGAAPVSEPIVKLMLEKASDGIDSEETTFREVFMEELVFGSSLVYREEGNKFYGYGMHRLVRGFVLSSMERGTEVWIDTFNLALLSTHERVEELLEADDKNFDDLPNFHEKHLAENYIEFQPHACSLIDHYSLPNAGHEIEYFSELVQLMKFSSELYCPQYYRLERKKVLESLLAALHYKYGKNTLTQEMIEPCRELAWTLFFRDMKDDAISILQQHLEMHRVDFGFNPEKYSKYIFDFNPELVCEIEDLLALH